MIAPDRLAVDQDDALVALAHVLEIALDDVGFAEHLAEHFEQRGEVAVGLVQMEDAGAAIAVERLDDDVAELLAEGVDFARVLGDQRFRRQVGKFQHEDLFRAVAHPGRVVDHQRLGMDALQNMRRGDVVHVEGRVLAQQDHVHFRQIGADGFAKREMIALLIADLEFLDARENLAAEHRQPVGRVMEKLVSAPLRFERQGKRRVSGNRDGRDMVHLDGDFERHGASSGRITPGI